MTDRELTELYLQRSEEAIAATERLYGSFCHAIAYRILGNREDAAEVVNDSYLKLWDLIPPQKPDPFKGFLGRITRQLSINRLEHNTAQKRCSGQYDAVLVELEDIACGDAAEPTEALALRDAINRFLRELPAEERQIFLLRYWHFSSIHDIAGATGASQSKIKMRLLRTRQKLKTFLEKEELL